MFDPQADGSDTLVQQLRCRIFIKRTYAGRVRSLPENLSIRFAGSPELVVHNRCPRVYTKNYTSIQKCYAWKPLERMNPAVLHDKRRQALAVHTRLAKKGVRMDAQSEDKKHCRCDNYSVCRMPAERTKSSGCKRMRHERRDRLLKTRHSTRTPLTGRRHGTQNALH